MSNNHGHQRFHIPEQGVRLAVTVPIFMVLGFYAFEDLEPKWNVYVFTWALWVAMTMVLASSNEMGGVISDGFRRLSAALITGVMATGVMYLSSKEHIVTSVPYIHQFIHSDAIIVGLAGIFVMFFAQVFAQITDKRKTAVIVSQLFLKCCFAGKAGDYYLIWSIVLGACTGAVMISLVSVIIFPRSASYKAMIELKLAMEKLAEFSDLTMNELIVESAKDQNEKKNQVNISMVDNMNKNAGILASEIEQEDNKLRKSEQMMFSIYNLLDDMAVSLKMSKNEVCLRVRETKEGPKWLLFPGAKIFRCCCSNPLPQDELRYVGCSIRRVARHLWAVLLSIDHMWDDTVKEVIKQRYPQEVLPQIHDLMTAVLRDICESFPGKHFVTMKNLASLEMVIELMLNISNRWRTRATIKKTRSDPLVQQMRSRALKRALTRKDAELKRTPQSLGAVRDTHKLGLQHSTRFENLLVNTNNASAEQIADRARSMEAAVVAALHAPIIHRNFDTGARKKWMKITEKVLENKFEQLEEQIPKNQDDTNDNPNQTEDVPQRKRLLKHGKNLAGSKSEQDDDADLHLALLRAENDASDGAVFRKLHTLGSVKSKKNLQVEVTRDARAKRREAAHVKGNTNSGEAPLPLDRKSQSIYSGLTSTYSNLDAISTTAVTSQSLAMLKNDSGKRDDSNLDVQSLILDIPLVEEKMALGFPETVEGHTQEARWYSFQFQIDELLDSIIELHTAVTYVLETKLPKLHLSPELIERYMIKQDKDK